MSLIQAACILSLSMWCESMLINLTFPCRKGMFFRLNLCLQGPWKAVSTGVFSVTRGANTSKFSHLWSKNVDTIDSLFLNYSVSHFKKIPVLKLNWRIEYHPAHTLVISHDGSVPSSPQNTLVLHLLVHRLLFRSSRCLQRGFLSCLRSKA